MDFNTLKSNRQNSLSVLQSQLDEAATGKKNYTDDRFWKLSTDKSDNGYAVIRFLPAKEGDVSLIKYWDHGFKGPGGWYIEKSLTSIDLPDPVTEYNSVLWNNGDKDAARNQKRRLHYVCNILVIKDSKNPQNEGRVFLFEFGKKIFDKIKEAIQPPFDEEGRAPDHENYDPASTRIDPFEMWKGANFKLAARKVEGFRNYEQSEFGHPSPVAETEKEMEAIFEQTHNVQELLNPKNFKTRAELDARLARVLGGPVAVTQEQHTTAPSSGKTKSAPKSKEAYTDDSDDEEFDLEALMKDL